MTPIHHQQVSFTAIINMFGTSKEFNIRSQDQVPRPGCSTSKEYNIAADRLTICNVPPNQSGIPEGLKKKNKKELILSQAD
ncbi:unnamed protein product [Linum tenue]|uniref:Uncharacterized protein n=1 Tax=Linum tenue TaxID=586396 RepID=A0AAV0RMT4_9ROSI|nr:unnamed protein product [Linum tenue]